LIFDIKVYEANHLEDVLLFENSIREQEEWGWEINEKYKSAVANSFSDSRFENSLSLLAYDGGKVIGRIDTAIIASHFDGSIKAYLDWICVHKDYRHKGAGQALLDAARGELKGRGIDTLVGIIAHNEEALSFYRAVKDAKIQDEGIWIDIK
jgi:ribosomal protein S18 acetylase RimI-like enzyme